MCASNGGAVAAARFAFAHRLNAGSLSSGLHHARRERGGGLRGITAELLAERERTVFEWARRRGVGVAFVLAGGYEGGELGRADLIDLHRLTIQEAAAGQAI